MNVIVNDKNTQYSTRTLRESGNKKGRKFRGSRLFTNIYICIFDLKNLEENFRDHMYSFPPFFFLCIFFPLFV